MNAGALRGGGGGGGSLLKKQGNFEFDNQEGSKSPRVPRYAYHNSTPGVGISM